jgi:hypothetical protein
MIAVNSILKNTILELTNESRDFLESLKLSNPCPVKP